jgi:hypothetical protein
MTITRMRTKSSLRSLIRRSYCLHQSRICVHKNKNYCNMSEQSRNNREKPKRALTAYNLFFQLERKRIIEGTDRLNLPVGPEDVRAIIIESKKVKPKRIHRRTHGKVTFGDLARIAAKRWKKLGLSTRQVYQNQAKLEKNQYERNLLQWMNESAKRYSMTSADIAENEVHEQEVQQTPHIHEGVTSTKTFTAAVRLPTMHRYPRAVSPTEAMSRKNEKEVGSAIEPGVEFEDLAWSATNMSTTQELSRSMPRCDSHQIEASTSIKFESLYEKPAHGKLEAMGLKEPRHSSFGQDFAEFLSSPIFRQGLAAGIDLREPIDSYELDQIFND